MRMARINVYLPDELAERVKASGINVSRLAQQALQGALDDRLADHWLDELAAMDPIDVEPAVVAAAVAAAKNELEGHA